MTKDAARTIQTSRSHLPGNPGAYARSMSAGIRSALSARTAKAIRAAIIEDGAEVHFVGLATGCPVAVEA
ncbi:hypothetical protein L2U69_11960 [Zavarzinia compransoris]|uniref:hypothetical protein n=1 Tax=Zavarzinia marina TaxID=2911065 RepID=UPI001F3AA648|nr:hypothetical protein [Zavarzinia marina]MCF4166361.1 hypothetical protein [Zavarzinia marina]